MSPWECASEICALCVYMSSTHDAQETVRSTDTPCHETQADKACIACIAWCMENNIHYDNMNGLLGASSSEHG